VHTHRAWRWRVGDHVSLLPFLHLVFVVLTKGLGIRNIKRTKICFKIPVLACHAVCSAFDFVPAVFVFPPVLLLSSLAQQRH